MKIWTGYVTLADPLSLPQAELWEQSIQMPASNDKEMPAKDEERTWFTKNDKVCAPAVLACVEKWELENFELLPDGSLPWTPRTESHNLIVWLHNEIYKIYIGEVIVPNE